MKREDIAECTGLSMVNDVWNIWSTTLPIAWHTKAAQVTALLTPPDDDDRVLCVLGSKRYFLVDLADLRPFRADAAVTLKDGRHGTIASIAHFSVFFLFHDSTTKTSEMLDVEVIASVDDAPGEDWLDAAFIDLAG